MDRFWVLWVSGTVLVVFMSLWLWVSLPSVAPDEGESVRLEDDLVLFLVDDLDGDAIGQFCGHEWPCNYDEGADSLIYMESDLYRYRLLQVCTHEYRHYELDEQGRNVSTHHERMDSDVYNSGELWPWEIEPVCLKVSPYVVV